MLTKRSQNVHKTYRKRIEFSTPKKILFWKFSKMKKKIFFVGFFAKNFPSGKEFFGGVDKMLTKCWQNVDKVLTKCWQNVHKMLTKRIEYRISSGKILRVQIFQMYENVWKCMKMYENFRCTEKLISGKFQMQKIFFFLIFLQKFLWARKEFSRGVDKMLTKRIENV